MTKTKTIIIEGEAAKALHSVTGGKYGLEFEYEEVDGKQVMRVIADQ